MNSVCITGLFGAIYYSDLTRMWLYIIGDTKAAWITESILSSSWPELEVKGSSACLCAVTVMSGP